MQSVGVAGLFLTGFLKDTFVLGTRMVTSIILGAISAVVRVLGGNRILAIVIGNGAGVADSEEGLRREKGGVILAFKSNQFA